MTLGICGYIFLRFVKKKGRIEIVVFGSRYYLSQDENIVQRIVFSVRIICTLGINFVVFDLLLTGCDFTGSLSAVDQLIIVNFSFF